MSLQLLGAVILLSGPLVTAGERVVTDFAGNGTPLQWFSVNDGVMGGRSSGGHTIERGVLVFTGVLNTNGGGFASLRTRPTAVKLGEFEGLALRVRGDGREYQVRLQQPRPEGQRWSASYRAKFTTKRGEWTDVYLRFSDFVPTWRGRRLNLPAIDPKRIDSLGISIADEIDGPFRLEVDGIRAYRPFAIEQYKWKNRPLVVFAPQASDARLQEQLAELRRFDAAFRERDMVLVVVLDDGRSYAGARPLDEAAVAKLRTRFGVKRGSFALKLVGYDGGVKRNADKPVLMSALSVQIDRMPMARAKRNRN